MTSVSASSAKDQRSSGTATIAITAADFLKKRGISKETAEKAGITEQNGALVIPYKKDGVTLNKKYRSLSEKKFWQDGGKQFVWNYDCLGMDGALIITEGELDALSFLEAGYEKVISVPNGGTEGEQNLQWLFDIEDKLGSEVILAFDNDNVGYALREQVELFIGRARCKWVKYPKDTKDMNEALVKYGVAAVHETVKRARWVNIKGLYKMSELAPLPYREPMRAGMGEIDDIMRLRFGDFSVVTGVPSHGKSTFVTDFLTRILENYNHKACIASFESDPQTDYGRKLRTWHSGKLEKYMSSYEIAAANEWIDERFMFIVQDDNDDATLDWLFDRMEAAVRRHGVKFFLIDPWNELTHIRDPNETLTEYTGRAIRLLKKFAKSRGVHVMVVAHPAKPTRNKSGEYPVPNLYDISDSQHWANKADLGIVVHRGEVDKVMTVKSRYHTEIGAVGEVEVKFNHTTGRFTAVDSVN